MRKWAYTTAGIYYREGQPYLLMHGRGIDSQDIHEMLAKMGQEGWELVGIGDRGSDEHWQSRQILYFKQPIPE